MDPGDLNTYVTISVTSFVVLWVVILSCRLFYERIYRPDWYTKIKLDKDRWYKLSCFSANCHHATVWAFGSYNFIRPKCGSEEFPNWSWFNDEVCFMTA